MSNLKNTYGFSSSLLDTIRSIHETSKEDVQLDEGFRPRYNDDRVDDRPPRSRADRDDERAARRASLLAAIERAKKESEDRKKQNTQYNSYEPEGEQIDEAQNLVPLISQLKALLSWLVSSGAIRKFAKEEAEVVGMLELLEYRTKGAKNRPAPSKESGEGHSEKGESNSEDDEGPNVYDTASKDGRHVIPSLEDAAHSSEGGSIKSPEGERPVSQKLAKELHGYLMNMKPSERAEHSAYIFNGKVPSVKTLNHIKTKLYIKKLGAERKFGSDEGVKRGRGRPKKNQD